MAGLDNEQGRRIGVLTAGVLLVAMSLGGLIGFVSSGYLGGLFGLLLGSAAALIFQVVMSARMIDGGLELRRITMFSELDPQLALTLFSGSTIEPQNPSPFESVVLHELAKLRDIENHSLSKALSELEMLATQYPHSAMIPAKMANLHHRAHDESAALHCISTAIELAIRGGMNPFAAKIFSEMGTSRDRHVELTISDRGWTGLARALDANGNSEGARWCRAHQGASSSTNRVLPESGATFEKWT